MDIVQRNIVNIAMTVGRIARVCEIDTQEVQTELEELIADLAIEFERLYGSEAGYNNLPDWDTQRDYYTEIALGRYRSKAINAA